MLTFQSMNRRSSEIQGTALGKCLWAWTCVCIHIYVYSCGCSSVIVQELYESQGGRPGLSVLTSLLVSVDLKLYWTLLQHWSQLVPNMLADIWGHQATLPTCSTEKARFCWGYSEHVGKMTDTCKQKAKKASEMLIKHSTFMRNMQIG